MIAVFYFAAVAGANVDEGDEDGVAGLHHAADSNRLDVLNVLIQNGANVNAVDNLGQTPLHYGVLCGNELVCASL